MSKDLSKYNGPVALIVGNLEIGFQLYGPFTDRAAANEFTYYLKEHDTGFSLGDDDAYVLALQSEASVRQYYAEHLADAEKE